MSSGQTAPSPPPPPLPPCETAGARLHQHIQPDPRGLWEIKARREEVNRRLFCQVSFNEIHAVRVSERAPQPPHQTPPPLLAPPLPLSVSTVAPRAATLHFNSLLAGGRLIKIRLVVAVRRREKYCLKLERERRTYETTKENESATQHQGCVRSSKINSSGRVRRVWLDDKLPDSLRPTTGLIPLHSTEAGCDFLPVFRDVFSLNPGDGGDGENPSGAAALCQKHSDLEKSLFITFRVTSIQRVVLAALAGPKALRRRRLIKVV